MSCDVHSCIHWLRPRNSLPPPHLDLYYKRALLVSKDRRHLFCNLLRGGLRCAWKLQSGPLYIHGNLWRGKQEILIKTSARQMAVWVHNHVLQSLIFWPPPMPSIAESFTLCRICSFHFKTWLVYVESTLILHCHKQTTQFQPADTQTQP